MRNADIVACREYSPGVISAADYFATGNAAPDLDPVQDWTTHAGGRVTPPSPPGSHVCPSGYTFAGNGCFKVIWNRKKDVTTWSKAKDALRQRAQHWPRSKIICSRRSWKRCFLRRAHQQMNTLECGLGPKELLDKIMFSNGKMDLKWSSTGGNGTGLTIKLPVKITTMNASS